MINLVVFVSDVATMLYLKNMRRVFAFIFLQVVL